MSSSGTVSAFEFRPHGEAGGLSRSWKWRSLTTRSRRAAAAENRALSPRSAGYSRAQAGKPRVEPRQAALADRDPRPGGQHRDLRVLALRLD
jgi:hypothetical protein